MLLFRIFVHTRWGTLIVNVLSLPVWRFWLEVLRCLIQIMQKIMGRNYYVLDSVSCRPVRL
ncbi:Uncharacterised protein [Enterobacter cloacae]|nr:Uncharacterised protein [Enterobacter cloacae]SAG28609.1 Uncharacterised protein [Enterobacter hormaechei]SAG32254.1 Uncharacterised protein [Enterobacter hormaechei]